MQLALIYIGVSVQGRTLKMVMFFPRPCLSQLLIGGGRLRCGVRQKAKDIFPSAGPMKGTYK